MREFGVEDSGKGPRPLAEDKASPSGVLARIAATRGDPPEEPLEEFEDLEDDAGDGASEPPAEGDAPAEPEPSGEREPSAEPEPKPEAESSSG